MKLLSICVPCYNSQDYMKKCIDSLLSGGDAVEVIVVNDGSDDGTLNIANTYAEEFPDSVKVIDKPNGGHGSAVNAGLKAATGLYFRVVDSDDWLDQSALKILLETIGRHLNEDALPDLYVSNFVYDKVSTGERHVSSYSDKMPVGRICGWEKVKKFRFSRMLLMHSLTFKREALIESGVVLPEHTFYVDNLFAYQPLPFTKTFYYLNINLYYYTIGRAGQSVTRKNIVDRYDQQIRVMLCIADAYKWEFIKKLPKGLKNYMWHALEAVMMNTLFFTCAKHSSERRLALKEMWRHIRKNDKKLYARLRRRSYATSVNYMTWRLRGRVLTLGYNSLCRRVKLG